MLQFPVWGFGVRRCRRAPCLQSRTIQESSGLEVLMGKMGRNGRRRAPRETHGKEETRKENARHCAPKSLGVNEIRKMYY